MTQGKEQNEITPRQSNLGKNENETGQQQLEASEYQAVGKEFLTCCVALDRCLKLPDLPFLHHKNESIMLEQQISNVCPFKSQGLVNKPNSLASTPGF